MPDGGQHVGPLVGQEPGDLTHQARDACGVIVLDGAAHSVSDRCADVGAKRTVSAAHRLLLLRIQHCIAPERWHKRTLGFVGGFEDSTVLRECQPDDAAR